LSRRRKEKQVGCPFKGKEARHPTKKGNGGAILYPLKEEQRKRNDSSRLKRRRSEGEKK